MNQFDSVLTDPVVKTFLDMSDDEFIDALSSLRDAIILAAAQDSRERGVRQTKNQMDDELKAFLRNKKRAAA